MNERISKEADKMGLEIAVMILEASHEGEALPFDEQVQLEADATAKAIKLVQQAIDAETKELRDAGKELYHEYIHHGEGIPVFIGSALKFKTMFGE